MMEFESHNQIKRTLKLLYATDLHGNKEIYLQIVDKVISESVNILILGADLAPKECDFWDSIPYQQRFLEYSLDSYLGKIKSKSPNTEIFLMLGNDDWASNLSVLKDMEKAGLCKVIHQEKCPFNHGFEIIGYSCVPPTPFSVKDFERIDKENVDYCTQNFAPCISKNGKIMEINVDEYFRSLSTIEKEIKSLPEPCDFKKTIYVFHAPPYNTKLDQLSGGKHTGSKAIREFILNKQPLLTLHGHIHESPHVSGSYWDTIGSTLCINPGDMGYVTLELSNIKDSLRYNAYK